LVKIICNNYLLYALMGVFVLGVLSRLILVALYNSLRRSTYNMAGSNNKLLKQVKLKYESYDKLEFPVTNAMAFTKRAMYEYRVCGMSLRFLEKFLGQAMFWCVAIGVTAVGCGYFFDYHRRTCSCSRVHSPVPLFQGKGQKRLFFKVAYLRVSRLFRKRRLLNSTENATDKI